MRNIPFVFITDRTRMFSLNYSTIPRLQKPFMIDDLHRTIMGLSSSRSLPRNIRKYGQFLPHK
jgi:hypothetical protein